MGEYNPNINSHKQRDSYLKWWKGKRCKPKNSNMPHTLVADVITYGPPSYVYGTACLVFEGDDREVNIFCRGKRPMKKDVSVLPDDVYEIKYGGHILYIRPRHGYTVCNLYLDTECTNDSEYKITVEELIGKPTWPYKVNPIKVQFKESYRWE